MAEKIRIPSTSVELVQIIGEIIRKHIKLSLQGRECWTFEKVADFFHSSFCDERMELEVDNYLDVYLGAGYFHAYIEDGPVQRVEARVRCTHNQWVPCNENTWTFELWLKPENGRIKRYCYGSAENFTNGEDIIYLIDNKKIPLLPPRKISFKGL